MDNILKITSGEVRLRINDDEKNLLVFNPDDIVFAEKFYGLAKSFAIKQKDFEARIKILQGDETKDEYDIPANTGDAIQLTKELCVYMRVEIDKIFGEGVSDRLFGDTNSVSMLGQFFDGIQPYVVKARSKKMAQYATKVNKSAVMK